MFVRLPVTVLSLLVLLVSLAACGGAAPAGGSPTGTGAATTAAVASAASSAPAETEEEPSPAEETPDETASGGGGVGVPADQCSLASTEEVSSATGVTVAQAVPIPGGGCSWNDADGALVANVVVISGDVAEQLWTGMSNPATGGQEVTGIGDEALWIGNTTSLVVHKGETVANIGIVLTMGDDATRRRIAEALGRVIAPRI